MTTYYDYIPKSKFNNKEINWFDDNQLIKREGGQAMRLQDNNVNRQMTRVWNLSRSADGICIAIDGEPIDSDCYLSQLDSSIFIEFINEDVEDMIINLQDIRDIVFDQVGDMTIAILKMQDNSAILIHYIF